MKEELAALVGALVSFADRETGCDAPAEHIFEVIEAICIRLDVPSGPAGPQIGHLDILNRCARAISKLDNPQPGARCVDLLLEATAAQLISGEISDAMRLAERALVLANQAKLRALVRRSLSLCSSIHGAEGRSLLAIDLAVKTAAVAHENGDRLGVLMATANMLAHYMTAGAFDEVLKVSPRFLDHDDTVFGSWNLAAIICANAANSAAVN